MSDESRSFQNGFEVPTGQEEGRRGAGDAAPSEEAFAELAQIIAHRIRSLTSSIESCADMLSEAVSDRSERELVLRILEGTARIEYVLSDLMLYGKPIHPTYLPLYVADVVHGVLSLLSERERQLIQVVDEIPDAVRISADPNLLRQALLAVVQNALDAVEMSADSSWVRIEAKHVAAADTVSVSVTNPGDTGLAGAREQVFRPFFTTKAQNLGLGLSIARRIVGVHEGTLELTGDDAIDGTRFEMTLPVAN